jgi:hypothetical protein
MKGILLGIAVLLLLVFTATDSQAQCQYCGTDQFTGCTQVCITTSYDASVLCTMFDFAINYTMCYTNGKCDGYAGPGPCGAKAPGCNIQLAEDWRGPHLPYRSGEWKLVSVTIKRGPDGRSSL